ADFESLNRGFSNFMRLVYFSSCYTKTDATRDVAWPVFHIAALVYSYCQESSPNTIIR
ncbi:unnamed protein product, partial (mitochondrion) [Musa textilis]